MAASFSVSTNLAGSQFSLVECTGIVGLTPTETWHAKRRIPDVPEMSWSIGFSSIEFETLNEAIVHALKMLAGHEGKIVAAAQHFGLAVTVTCNIKIRESAPLYDLSASTMRSLADLRAELLLDIFDETE